MLLTLILTDKLLTLLTEFFKKKNEIHFSSKTFFQINKIKECLKKSTTVLLLMVLLFIFNNFVYKLALHCLLLSGLESLSSLPDIKRKP